MTNAGHEEFVRIIKRVSRMVKEVNNTLTLCNLPFSVRKVGKKLMWEVFRQGGRPSEDEKVFTFRLLMPGGSWALRCDSCQEYISLESHILFHILLRKCVEEGVTPVKGEGGWWSVQFEGVPFEMKNDGSRILISFRGEGIRVPLAGVVTIWKQSFIQGVATLLLEGGEYD